MIDHQFHKYVRSRFAMAEMQDSQYMTFAQAEIDFLTFLEQAMAVAWDEGYEAGSNDGCAWQDVTEGYTEFDDYEDTPNPYRDK